MFEGCVYMTKRNAISFFFYIKKFFKFIFISWKLITLNMKNLLKCVLASLHLIPLPCQSTQKINSLDPFFLSLFIHLYLTHLFSNQKEKDKRIKKSSDNGETDIQNRLKDTGRGEERMRCM